MKVRRVCHWAGMSLDINADKRLRFFLKCSGNIKVGVVNISSSFLNKHFANWPTYFPPQHGFLSAV